jgi:hypothetical protein
LRSVSARRMSSAARRRSSSVNMAVFSHSARAGLAPWLVFRV